MMPAATVPVSPAAGCFPRPAESEACVLPQDGRRRKRSSSAVDSEWFRWIALGVLAYGGLIGIEASGEAPEPSDRPNVLLLMVDDLRPEIGAEGVGRVHTPRLDDLAQRSRRFTSAYCQVPVCGASRASLMTGLYPTSERFRHFNSRADREAPGAITLPQHLRASGYITLSLGKILHHAADTQERSWTEPPWQPPGDPLTDMQLEESRQWRSERGRGPLFEAAPVDDGVYWDGRLAQRAREELARLRARDEPFFLACGFFRPHLPFYAPRRYWDLFDREKLPIATNRFRPIDAPAALTFSGEFHAYHSQGLEPGTEAWHRAMVHGYLASVSYVDALIGTVLDELDRLGLRENTLVVLTSDHGWFLGEHDLWCKHATLREALRVPLWLSHPRIAPGVDDRWTELVDLFPTLVEWAGAPPLVRLPGHILVRRDGRAGAFERDHIYARYAEGDAVLMHDYSYTRYSGMEPGEMLFDRRADPAENINVARHPAYADALEMMRSRLDATLGAIAAGRRPPFSPPALH
jgi:iduronate 2-sulfatase